MRPTLASDTDRRKRDVAPWALALTRERCAERDEARECRQGARADSEAAMVLDGKKEGLKVVGKGVGCDEQTGFGEERAADFELDLDLDCSAAFAKSNS